jgi:adenylosuccinate lyase
MTPEVSTSSACEHTRSHIVDSRFYGHRYSTLATHRIFCDRCRFQRWLTIEAALAGAQAELGIIPATAAEHIRAAASVDLLDLDHVREQIARTGHSLVGLLRTFQEACADGAGQFIHYGATTQDIQDTAQSMEMRDVLDVVEGQLASIVGHLIRIADEHGDNIALGRTHAQPALPMTFGIEVAGWIDELLRHAERVDQLRPRAQVAQLFGGVGTMAGLGDQALELLVLFSERLGLSSPLTGWHVSRDRIAEYASVLAMIARTMGRIGDEVRMLSRPEFGELEEGWSYGKVGSSTMPHKRNPEACEQAVVLARLATAQVPLALEAMSPDNERDSRALRLEWVCVADVSHFTSAACGIVEVILSGLIVHGGKMLTNVTEVADQLASERLMLALAGSLGKQDAHERVYDLSQSARRDGVRLRDLASKDEAAGALGERELDHIFDPANHVGLSDVLTARVLDHARDWVAVHPAGTGP